MTIPATSEIPSSTRRGLAARTLRQPRAYLSAGWLALLVLASVILPLTGLLHPLTQDPAAILKPPSGAHWLGTDELGRDILARLIYGARDALVLSLEVVAVSVAIGAPLGLWAGFGSRWGDWVSARFADLMLAIPVIIVLLAVVSIVGNSMPIAALVLGVLVSAGNIRLVRASTQAAVKELYVDAARVSGLSGRRIAFRHVLPNVAGPLIVQSSIIAGIALLALTGLQFLGLGPNPPAPSWGGLVSEASANISRQPWMMVPSGLAVILTVLAFNQLGDALRDALAGPGRSSLLAPARNAVAQAARRAAGAGGAAHEEQPAAGGTPLVVEDVSVTAPHGGGPVTLVDQVSLTVAKGETVGIVGESGCGKSMTALAILGLLPSNVTFAAGKVIVGGEDLAAMTEKQRRRTRGTRIAAIPQEPMTALDPNFTIGKQLTAPARRLLGLTRAQARAEALRLLDAVGIVYPETVFRSYPHEISGGMAQRVCIAQALIGKPQVLIADEPTTALDVTVQAEILDLLRGLQREMGMAIVLVTHNLGVVADICDRAMVMYAGQIVETAPTGQLLSAPTHPYTLSLLGSIPSRTNRGAALPTIRGTVPRPENWAPSCRFADRCPLVTDTCRAQPVPLARTASGSYSRCIRTGELARLRALPTDSELEVLER
jgi:peptide/nickel transport system ATP-binding protein/peptide/nickel transport system permease protein